MAGLEFPEELEHSRPPSPSISGTGMDTPSSATPPSYDDIPSWFPKYNDDDIPTSVPEPGHMYMIRETITKKAITLVDGCLTVLRDPKPGVGWHWHCEEQNGGWVGFREAVSGKYLGHNNSGGFRVTAAKMKSWEWFVLRPRAAGGYNLYVTDWSDLKAMGISDVMEARPKLVIVADVKDAARWEFIRL